VCRSRLVGSSSIGHDGHVAEEHRDDRGRGWIAWTFDAYEASLQGGSLNPQINDPGIVTASLDEALAWARARTDWVMVRPRRDNGTYYWAGVGPVPERHEIGQAVVPIWDSEDV
jgi:hypothetical protein